MELHEIVDLGRYPVDCPDSAALRRLKLDLQEELAEDGCAVLPGFAHARGVAALVAEADGAADAAHRSFNRTNAYFTKDNPQLPAAHPVRRFFERSNAFVPADNFAQTGPLRTIYAHPGFLPFIREVLGEPE